MIIQCEKCKTRFRLDDSKISEAGVRVRCSRCSHTFVVRRDAPEEEHDFDSILLGLGDAPPAGQEDATEGNDESGASCAHGLSEGETPAAPEPGESGALSGVGDTGSDSGVEFQQGAGAAGEAFGDFFGTVDDKSHDQPQEVAAGDAEEQSAAPGPEESDARFGEWEPESDDDAEIPQAVEQQEEAFSDVFGTGEGMPHFQADGEAAEEAVEEAVATEQAAEAELESDVRPFADEPEAGDVVSGVEPEAVPPSEAEESVRQSLERVRFGSVSSPGHEQVRWPVADGDEVEPEEDELPPLSISSRRKGARLFPVLLGTLLVLVLGGAGYYLMQGGTVGLSGMLPDGLKQLIGDGKTTQAAAVRSLEGEFISNSEAGELFVMRGEVFNSSKKPIASLQVKGTVYGPNGEALAQRTVFCGNTLSREQLALQSYSSMEKVMGSRFGDTLANLEVSPGKAVPFLIVFRDVPKGATDFGAVVFEAAVR